MAGSVYLYLDFIPGESTAMDHNYWIDVSSYSLGCSMEVDQEARTSSGGGTSGSGDPEDLSIDKKMDAATTSLLFCCATGVIIPRGKLMNYNDVGQGKRKPVSEFAFGDSIITNVNLNGSGSGIPDESLSINYGSIIWKYYCYNHYWPAKLEQTFQRAWSLISADPGTPDPSAISALDISGENYWDIDRGNPPLGFKEVTKAKSEMTVLTANDYGKDIEPLE